MTDRTTHHRCSETVTEPQGPPTRDLGGCALAGAKCTIPEAILQGDGIFRFSGLRKLFCRVWSRRKEREKEGPTSQIASFTQRIRDMSSLGSGGALERGGEESAAGPRLPRLLPPPCYSPPHCRPRPKTGRLQNLCTRRVPTHESLPRPCCCCCAETPTASHRPLLVKRRRAVEHCRGASFIQRH